MVPGIVFRIIQSFSNNHSTFAFAQHLLFTILYYRYVALPQHRRMEKYFLQGCNACLLIENA